MRTVRIGYHGEEPKAYRLRGSIAWSVDLPLGLGVEYRLYASGGRTWDPFPGKIRRVAIMPWSVV